MFTSVVFHRYRVTSVFVVAVLLLILAPAAHQYHGPAVARARLLRSMQETMLRFSMDRAQLNYGIVFVCRKTSNIKTGTEVHFMLQLGDLRGFSSLNPKKKLALFLHGWNDEGSKEWVQDLLKTWTYYAPNYNVCVVDWGHLSQLDYKTASMSIFDVGLTVAGIIMALEKLKPRYFSRRNVTIAGYSLGAHAAGHAGAVLNGELEQIIGLDPAGPLFTLPAVVSPTYRLDAGDAQFVQVLHTSSGTLGTSIKSGHADFYPNGGKTPQPNCMIFNDFMNGNPFACSHSTAAVFFKESMNPYHPFMGLHCSSYKAYRHGACTANHHGRFGIHSQRHSHGDFYFETDSKSPYVQRLPFMYRMLRQRQRRWRRQRQQQQQMQQRQLQMKQQRRQRQRQFYTIRMRSYQNHNNNYNNHNNISNSIRL